MIDLILVAALGAAFYVGFRLGNKYTTLVGMAEAGWSRVTKPRGNS